MILPCPLLPLPRVGGGRGNPRGKQLRFYRRPGIDNLNAEVHWRTGARSPRWGERAASGTWAPSAPPRRWAPDTAACHHSSRRVSTPANAVFAACLRWPFSPTRTTCGQGGAVAVAVAVAVTVTVVAREACATPGTKPGGGLLFCLPGRLKTCLFVLSLSICLLGSFVFDVRERCV